MGFVQNSIKINHQIFQQIEKTMFLASFGLFFSILGQKIFSENPALSRTTSYELQATYQILEKTYDTIPRKYLDRSMDRRTEGRTNPIL